MSRKQETIFMTGATGFLGIYLLRDLLAAGQRVVAMVREPESESRDRLFRFIGAIGVDAAQCESDGQLVLVSGSLPDELPDVSAYAPDAILASGASLQLFSNGTGDPFRTNVEGTKQLLAFADRHGIQNIHAVSTAYVCGSFTKDVGEVFHHPQPEFYTDYETSKWQAENLLADWGTHADHNLTVFRPSFLVGDSETGFTTQFGGFYQFVRLFGMLKDEYGDGDNGESTHIPLRIPGQADDPQNFIPVDFASKVTVAVMQQRDLHGKIYHLTDPSPITNAEFKKLVEGYFRIHGGYFEDSKGDAEPYNAPEARIWEQFAVSTPRVAHNPRFRLDNTKAVMTATGITCASLDELRFAMLVDFAKGCQWGKRLLRQTAVSR